MIAKINPNEFNCFYEPTTQLRSNRMIIYDKYIGPRGNREQGKLRAENMKEQRKKAYKGQLSKGGKKRLERAIYTLTKATKKRKLYNPVCKAMVSHHLSFLTLTVSDSTTNYTSREVQATCLRPFLDWLVKTHQVKLYIWKAELQKRGQVHYHIIFPNLIPYWEIKNKWNYLQLKAGYLEGYFEKYGSYSPNSVDIHSMYKVKDAAAYLAKYMTKAVKSKSNKCADNAPSDVVMDGKVWDCSSILKSVSYFEFLYSYTFEDLLNEALAKGKAIMTTFERFSIVDFAEGLESSILPLSDLIGFKQYYNNVYIEACSAPPPDTK